MTNIWKALLGTCTTLAGILLLGPAAGAQTACNVSIGPDIIVGDLQDVANYPGQTIGTVSYDAVSFGTYSCNIGTTWCNWIAGTNQHPVIDNNLYKYSVVGGAGHFEQIGMSWLKHGFFALSQTLCCSGCQATDGSHLGVRCSDPYTASRNGGQSGAGPRWQVNAATGVFTYPPANPSFSGSVARRCRVATTDLEPSSASVKYFAEAQYVTQDDATAGNKNNNCSYRGLTVGGSGAAWNFSLLGLTQRESPAIKGWQAADPAVQLQNIDLAGDGRVVFGCSATAIGGNQWHYEYAIFNMNSEDSIGGFSVPVGTAVITNVGFHDVDYHDGDGPGNVNFDGSDWPSSISGGVLTWSTTPFTQNPTANAIRWGTMYTFRFDADAPPALSQLALTTFKSATTLTINADSPTGVPGGAIVSFCFPSTNGVIDCPCNNPPLFPGPGCNNSFSSGGAFLNALGNASLSTDTVAFSTVGEQPNAASILLQGDAVNSAGVPFGQGVRCAAGSLKRLYLKAALGGSITVPQAGDQPISIRSAALGDSILGGTHRYYQVFYRDPAGVATCVGALGFNVTPAFDVTWTP